MRSRREGLKQNFKPSLLLIKGALTGSFFLGCIVIYLSNPDTGAIVQTTQNPNGQTTDINSGTVLSDNLITRTLIDTESFASFFKNLSERNEEIIAEFTGIKIHQSISDRIPTEVESTSPGFDAAVATTLALIPTTHVKRIIELHNGGYTTELISEMRSQIDSIIAGKANPDDYDAYFTFWWLAMSSVCTEGNTNSVDFYNQYINAATIYNDFHIRYKAAISMIKNLDESFTVDVETNVPYGTTDGCLHSAYLAGYEVASMFAESYGIYFLGTYVPGKFDNIIENHTFSTEVDDSGRTKSGVINPTFLKFGSYEELKEATTLL